MGRLVVFLINKSSMPSLMCQLSFMIILCTQANETDAVVSVKRSALTIFVGDYYIGK